MSDMERRLESALRRLASSAGREPARQAAASLRVALEGVRRSCWPEVAWSFSHLTSDGFPVELTFSSRDDAVRYTCEVSGPETPAAERLGRADRLLAALGGRALPLEMRHRFEDLQRGGSLTFGAWLGGRHLAAESRYKVYVEVPRDAPGPGEEFARETLGPEPLRHGRPCPLRMVGFDPGSGVWELYFRSERLEAWELPLLLRRAGLEGHTDRFLSALHGWYERPVQPALPGVTHGFSLAGKVGEPPRVFSLFTPARRVFAHDGAARRRLLRREGGPGGRLRGYGVLFGDERDPAPYHGIASFLLAPDGEAELRVGVRPRWRLEEAVAEAPDGSRLMACSFA